MSIEEIATRVGISKGTVYLHFVKKDDLVVALVLRGMRAVTQATQDALVRAGTPREKIQALFARSYDNLSGERFKVMRTLFESPEIRSRLAERRHELREAMEQNRQELAAIVEAGKASGDFDPTLPTPVIIALLSSLTNPMSYHSLVVEERMPAEEVVRYLSRFFFKGIAPEAASPQPASPENGDQIR